ncbi:AP-3 complex subunit mu-1 [Hypsibius exemplaris]|uniref:AP-3 complex subunit mu-1 n=1 Tax=Hypsibius exemplaris TaxID=2072580 RepID=A0A1W0WLU7_HYPEX|nr:AP-3 complex subunit mu-1 [Hypsibius exemplaris]
MWRAEWMWRAERQVALSSLHCTNKKIQKALISRIAMLHSFFIVNASGDVFLEKHWKSVIHRNICEYFFEAQKKYRRLDEIPPIIHTPHHYLIIVHRSNLFYIGVVNKECPPLFCIEIMHRIVDIFEDYFGDSKEATIKEHFVVVYELLDEMLDNGYPLATESNILKELIKPPSFLRALQNTVTGSSNVSSILPTGQLSNVPWRRAGVKYTNNEAYFDVIEEIDAIVDKSGSIVSAEIQGYIDSVMKLSGIPDLSLTFMNARIFDDVSFHPCVRIKRWESDRMLSFIPPDGHFRLMSYHIGSSNLVPLPIYIRHNIQFKTGASGRVDITVGLKQTMGRPVEDVKVDIPMPKSCINCSLTPTQGKFSYDTVSKVGTWEVGRIDPQKLPNIRGTVQLISGSDTPESNPTLGLHFKVEQVAMSGLRVNRLDILGEKYKPFKGVKYLTKAGLFQVRT